MKDAISPIDDEELQLIVLAPNFDNGGFYRDDGEKWIIKVDNVPIKAWNGQTSWASEKLARSALAGCHNLFYTIREQLAQIRKLTVDRVAHSVTYGRKVRNKVVKTLINSGRVVIERIQ